MGKRVNSYDISARTPAIGSRWVWEIDEPHARSLIEVIEVRWNGEEWWIKTLSLLVPQTRTFQEAGEVWNDLSRFAEAVTPVGATQGRWRQRLAATEAAYAKPRTWTGET